MRTLVFIALVLFTVVAAGVTSRATRQAKPRFNQELFARHSSHPKSTATGANPHESVVVEHFFSTQVDHFDLQNTEQWTLRYFSNTELYRDGGPIFIFLGGFRPIVPSMIGDTTLIYEMAREVNGAIFAFESRFYGISQVTGDLSTENLSLLNADQILADLAEFVTHIRREFIEDENARVLVAGSEWGGGLAAWFRIRYPHLGNAAWSSSGYMNAMVNFADFSEAWGDTMINHGSQECYSEIFVAFHVMQNLIDMGRADVLFDKFNICHEIDADNEFQVQYFFYTLMGSIELFTIARKNLADFTEVCDAITGADSDTAVDSFANWFNNRWLDDDECLVSDPDVSVERFQDTDWESDFNALGARQALYQECTEFGWFFTTDSPFQPFGDRVGVDFFIELCSRIFGEWITLETITQGVDRSNNRFGGINPGASLTHFTNGDADPWRKIGITRNITQDITAVIIPDQLGSSDLPAISEDDPIELQTIKRKLKNTILGYLFPDAPVAPANV
ncbi:putative serine protease K12H4.7 [Malaya genurostris]|uniref:putative serine protease K12H4.7 n=1 Tax=Malaya genurostris TaxID=325434 RepID=UPI0026F40896|nr:putative serine protease K12H4.7 [Malaya genurostris]